MSFNLSRIAAALLAFAALVGGGPAAATDDPHPVAWQTWTDDLFAQAAAQQRFVILDLEAIWCHWCHVMDRETYRNPQVAAEIGEHYIAVRVDQDANPDLANRYGDWGWPATIVFAPDGTEIVKRRGFIPPVQMLSMLNAIVEDPSPGPSVLEEPTIQVAAAGGLSAAQVEQLRADYWRVYDAENGGWGNVHKYIDGPSVGYALERARGGERLYELMARQTLGQSLLLIDREWGGIFQYSDRMDWRSPHYEKITTMQATAMRSYAAAHQQFGSETETRYLDGALAIARYMADRMRAEDGAFYTSQDADLNATVSGQAFYALHAEARAKLAAEPRIDRNQYTRENGLMVAALATLYDASADPQMLDAAQRAARWALAERRREDGGFDHGVSDRGGPFLGANVAMAAGFLALHRSTGERSWLAAAVRTLEFVDTRLRSATAGYLSHPVPDGATGVFAKELLRVEENVDLARTANLAFRYTAAPRLRAMAERAMRYLASPTLTDNRYFLHGVLLANREVGSEPVHITIVGGKDDPSARSLHAAARRFGAVYKRVDWWDKSEGPLPNPDVTYPQLARAAAFACTEGTCSLPVFEPAEVGPAVSRLLAAP